MRIHITGGPGAGKSTLARSLAQDLGLNLIDLDGQMIEHFKAQGGAIDFGALATSRLAENEIAAAEASWLSEGANVLVAQPFFERADVIVALYTSWRIASFRILARHFKANLAGNNRFPGIGNLYRFWRWSGRYYRNTNPSGLNEWGTPMTLDTLEDALKPYEAKVIRCRTRAEVAGVVRLLTQRLRQRRSPRADDGRVSGDRPSGH